MENGDGGAASWEQVHRILFPDGPVPESLINTLNPPPPPPPPPAAALHPGAGILGPGPPPGFHKAANFSPAPPPPPLAKCNAPENLHFGLPPPPPRDPKLLHYIKLFAAFVAKFGVENEGLVRAKHHGRPEFCFLFGGDPGSEAGVGSVFYQWQKDVISKVLEARRAVSEGLLPPDRLKSMQRELEHFLDGATPLKDLRLETILGLPENGKLDWQKIAWELGVSLPGEKRNLSQQPQVVESVDKDKKPKAAGDAAPPEHVRDWGKGERPRDSNDEFSPSSRRRRNRSRSRSPDRGRYRNRSRSPPRRSPRRRSRSPRRFNRRSYSRSPPRRKSPPPPRRNIEELPEPLMPYALPPPQHLMPQQQQQQHHMLAQHQLQQQVGPAAQEHVGGGFIPADNSFGRFMCGLEPQGGAQHHAPSQDSGLRLPAPFPQVGVPFAPALSEIPVQQQQFLLQQLQLSQMQSLSNHQAPVPLVTNAWTNPEAQQHQQHQQHLVLGGGAGDGHQFVPPPPPPQIIAPLFNQPPQHQQQHQQLQQQHQQQQLQLQQQQVVMLVNSEKYDPLRPASPPNDVDMEVGGGSPKAEKKAEANGVASVNGEKGSPRKSKDKEEESGKGSEKEKDSRALKIVRNTVAEFVKELLTPKWKDGILSKDDFKVIAQKAVNKVVGNLQGSQIPKGSERVDRFMTSSREKITKLVQEYVEKHTKNAPVQNPAAPSAEAAPPA